ncbi:MAG: YdiU family protein [Pseudomonadales bacterium]|jgi:uncharacterized protein YdiU (UPF0061 family)
MATALAGLPDFDNSYARLPERFYSRQPPDPVPEPRLVRLNRDLARELGFDPDAKPLETWAGIFSGNDPVPGIEPLAMAYAGHQFGNFVPQLGDGRALLLGEVIDRHGDRRDVQLKGAGRTPFSRQGDGRAALGPVLREYVVSEAMHALGIPTTRALAAVVTGEAVYRETALPGAILTRVARSHVRVGTFQYFAARNDHDAVRTLADYVIARHYPEIAGSPAPYLALLERFCERQALLVARWLGVGFIHGVMNTDNVSIAGETIDFGPCAFLDEYDPQKVFSSIDHMGRYAYGRQPGIAQWNVARFAETLLALLADDEDEAVRLATDAVNGFGTRFEAGWIDVMGKKLGLSQPCATDATLIRRLLGLMEAAGADFTLTFRWLADVVQAGYAPESLEAYLPPTEERASWLADWRARLANEGTETAIVNALRQTNPVFIPRNHQVERVIESAVSEGDFAPFEQLLSVLAHPFDERPEDAEYARPPEPHERVTRTFCGT